MIRSVTTFGTLPDGRRADLFTLDGGEGVTAAITNYGGIIVSLVTPDRHGTPGHIGLGRPTLQQYLDKPSYFGALIGRVANRIRDGRFRLDGGEYRLWTNDRGVHLHGGKEGFNRKLWEAETDPRGLRLQYLSPDGEESYPGDLAVTVWYRLVGRDLTIDYTATTDRPTVVSLTNHQFFNLTGGTGDVLGHQLCLRADRYTPVDERLLPTGEIRPVAGTALDFTAGKTIGRDIDETAGGYDHNFIFSEAVNSDPDHPPVTVVEPESGRTLTMTTTEPCVQFYSGNFLDGSDIGHDGAVYRRHYGFCLEAQKHPDAVNHPAFASVVLRPGETYRQTTTYRFGTT
ncbi:MAG: galactose mutarotase [Planctomycetes bacterium]|nr:galactose mutarotase [Planctomycetota bacterium]